MRVQRLADVDAAEHAHVMQREAADVQHVLPQVQAIMEAVRERGDAAVREFVVRFDGVQLHDVRVSAEEMATARQQVEPALLESLKWARQNPERFHRQQLSQEQVHELQPGIRTGRLWRPIEKVSLYAPGG